MAIPRTKLEPSALRYDWYGAINRLEWGSPIAPYAALRPVIEVATWFVGKWADWAQMAKMQPAHLLKFEPLDRVGRGLAWRWTDDMDVICFPREYHLVVESVSMRLPRQDAPTLFVYRFHPDGRVTHVLGSERSEILGAQITLGEMPNKQRQYIAALENG